MKRAVYLNIMILALGLLAFQAAGAPQASEKQPVEIYLYARITDHINMDFTEDRLRRILPMLDAYRKQHPESHVTATLLFSGAVSQALADRNAQTGIKDYVMGFVRRGVVEVGYDGTDEPTYDNRPKINFPGPVPADTRWHARSDVAQKFLTEARDPLTGAALPAGTGGLKKMEEVFGQPACITGVSLSIFDPFFNTIDLGSDSETVQQLVRMCSQPFVMFGVPATNPTKLRGYRDWATNFSKILSPSSDTSPELYWQDNVLRSSESSDATVRVVLANEGPDALKAVIDKLDRSKVRVLHIELAAEKGYVKPPPPRPAPGTAPVPQSGPPVPPWSPVKFAYANPDRPKWPEPARASVADVDAAFANEDALLKWVVEDFVPANSGSHIVGSKELMQMTEPSTGYSVSVARLRTALGAYTAAWAGDTVPAPFIRVDDHYLSLGDMFQVMTDALAGMNRTGTLPQTVRVVRAWGPMNMPLDSGKPGPAVTVKSLASVCATITGRLHADTGSPIPSNSIPSHVTIENQDVNAAQFLHMMAEALVNPAPDAQITIKTASMIWGGPAIYMRTRPVEDMGATWTMKPAIIPAGVQSAAR
jgi:hypothetical protein